MTDDSAQSPPLTAALIEIAKLNVQLARVRAQLAAVEKALHIAELKNRGTLANNLCPDHRDKQTGKPCLACSVESLEDKLRECERDAKRYRWLRSSAKRSLIRKNFAGDIQVLQWAGRTEANALHEEALDKAIDAAKGEPT